MRSERHAALRFLSGLRGHNNTMGRLISALRLIEGLSQAELARRLGIRRAMLCDFEQDRRVVMPSMASALAKILGYSEVTLVGFAVEDWLARDGLRFSVALKAQSRRRAQPQSQEG